MTASPNDSNQATPAPDSSQSDSIKGLIIKGVAGAIALAGTTAIPIVVQQVLQAPASAPNQTLPATQQVITPTAPSTAPVVATPQLELQESQSSDSRGSRQEDEKGGKSKGKKD
ncbi:MAG TPA: hypothetical protein V6D07_17755 [Trichocoleus sp.]